MKQFFEPLHVWSGASFIACASGFSVVARSFGMSFWWILGLVAVLLVVTVIGFLAYRSLTARISGSRFKSALDADMAASLQSAPTQQLRDELQTLKGHFDAALKTIKTSKLGFVSGSAALYELPWYAVIGNPAAGKSSAVARSGLNFPFADSGGRSVQGVGGTRNCDWFFTSEGILLDTAGRYAVQHEDRAEWLGFLALLKRSRPKAPLNGVIIAASLGELSNDNPDASIALARKLRERVQELTEALEIFVPVYVMFTKTDMVSGFLEFFEDSEPSERDRVWGATLPYVTTIENDFVASFDRHFDELHEGLKEASIARMSMSRGRAVSQGVLRFPMEFANIKPRLRTFIATLFEDNPYQFRPIFRGFYFTSALQDGQTIGRTAPRITERFGLHTSAAPEGDMAVVSQGGFFLRELFTKVVFADRQLVRRYMNRGKSHWRQASFVGGALLLGSMLAGWSWSYTGNRQLAANVQADLAKVVKIQEGRTDLQSRLEALGILQDRLEQFQRYRVQRPWQISLGLYQGAALEAKVRKEYFDGLQDVMLRPTTAALAVWLSAFNAGRDGAEPLPGGAMLSDGSGAAPVNAHVASLRDAAREPEPEPESAASAAAAAAATKARSDRVSEAYNALKTYIMLGDRSRLEAAHLDDQLTRYWQVWLEANRGSMTREELSRSAEQILLFAISQLAAPDFPSMQLNPALVDATRRNLRLVVKGMPARERVYAEIKARAGTRYPAITVAGLIDKADQDVLAGSYAISGAFTKEAWTGFIDSAFKDASNNATQADDWVLKTVVHDDLTLDGSPEEIRKALVQLYKADYVIQWQRFMQGVGVREFTGFEGAVRSMDRLGDPLASPLGKLIKTLHEQTSWDDPEKGGRSMGSIGREFAGISRLMSAENGTTLLRDYLNALSKVRTRFNQMQNQGNPGLASRQLMVDTLEEKSELAEALKLVDEQLLINQTEAGRSALRPVLVRPLMQSFAVLVPESEKEINELWSALIYEPFQKTLADKLPFDEHAQVVAGNADVAGVFGPTGTIARFRSDTLGSLVVQRGNTLSPKTWGDMGLRLRPRFVEGYVAWTGATPRVADLPGDSPDGVAAGAVTRFQILAAPVAGLAEYTIEIDGQRLRYRNTSPAWAEFVWPSNQGSPGVSIKGVNTQGRAVEFLSEQGPAGLEKMLGTAQRKQLGDGRFELSWNSNGQALMVQLRLLPGATAGGSADRGERQASTDVARWRRMSIPALAVGSDVSAHAADPVRNEAAMRTDPSVSPGFSGGRP